MLGADRAAAEKVGENANDVVGIARALPGSGPALEADAVATGLERARTRTRPPRRRRRAGPAPRFAVSGRNGIWAWNMSFFLNRILLW
jgi:hypothetical protein